MDTKTCSMCNIEKHKQILQKKFRVSTVTVQEDYKDIIKRKIKNQISKKYITKKNRDKKLLQKKNNRCIQIRELVRSYVELQNRLKAMEEKFKINDSEKH